MKAGVASFRQKRYGANLTWNQTSGSAYLPQNAPINHVALLFNTFFLSCQLGQSTSNPLLKSSGDKTLESRTTLNFTPEQWGPEQLRIQAHKPLIRLILRMTTSRELHNRTKKWIELMIEVKLAPSSSCLWMASAKNGAPSGD